MAMINLEDVPRTYEIAAEIGKGAYGTVYKARDLRNPGQFVAVKEIRILSRSEEGMPMSTLREIAMLRNLEKYEHPNIVRLLDVHPGRQSLHEMKLMLVFEHVDQDLAQYLKKLPSCGLGPDSIKDLMLQMMNGVDFLHTNRIVHRDLKPQNILVTSQGRVKIADFGLARIYAFTMALTSVVVTLYYRAPEVLLQGTYCTAVDIWSCGAIFAELHMRKPLFEGTSEIDQLCKIFQTMGLPPYDQWPPNVSLPRSSFNKFEGEPKMPLSACIPDLDSVTKDLLQKMLLFNQLTRVTAANILKHPYFTDEEDGGTGDISMNSLSSCGSFSNDTSCSSIDDHSYHSNHSLHAHNHSDLGNGHSSNGPHGNNANLLGNHQQNGGKSKLANQAEHNYHHGNHSNAHGNCNTGNNLHGNVDLAKRNLISGSSPEALVSRENIPHGDASQTNSDTHYVLVPGAENHSGGSIVMTQDNAAVILDQENIPSTSSVHPLIHAPETVHYVQIVPQTAMSGAGVYVPTTTDRLHNTVAINSSVVTNGGITNGGITNGGITNGGILVNAVASNPLYVSRPVITASTVTQSVHNAPQQVHIAPQHVHIAPQHIHTAPQHVHIAPQHVHIAPQQVVSIGIQNELSSTSGVDEMSLISISGSDMMNGTNGFPHQSHLLQSQHSMGEQTSPRGVKRSRPV